jgi:hypothetical protein
VHPTHSELEPSPRFFFFAVAFLLFPHCQCQRDTYHDPCEMGLVQ